MSSLTESMVTCFLIPDASHVKHNKAIFDKELEMHDDRVKKFLEVSRKLKNEKSGYAE